jgi:hypothetical protein
LAFIGTIQFPLINFWLNPTFTRHGERYLVTGVISEMLVPPPQSLEFLECDTVSRVNVPAFMRSGNPIVSYLSVPWMGFRLSRFRIGSVYCTMVQILVLNLKTSFIWGRLPESIGFISFELKIK